MKVIFGSILIALVIGIVAALVLNMAQRPAYEVYSTISVRVGEPGHNLVGENWSGNPERPRNG
jgi:uncharacterized protein involved in exopolysaccharide biosynthesis